MPPKGMDCNGLVFGFLNSDGQWKSIDFNGPNIKDVKIEDNRQIGDENFYDWLENAVPIEMRIPFKARNVRGMMDVLLGLETPAAGRYKRYSKRMKEKKRRKKLKEGKHED